MNINLIAVCDNEKCMDELKKTCTELGVSFRGEIQKDGIIKNEIAISEINNASIILFAVNKNVESIEKIERFIDMEYYEVEPKYVYENCNNVLKEILSDLN